MSISSPGGGASEALDAPTPGLPFNRPSLVGAELDYMRQAVEHGHTSADGPFSAKAARILGEELDAAQVLLTTSCTAALELSALLLDIEPGDSVIVPSYGFVTTALAFARQGATIRFCDIEPTTLGMDPVGLERLMDDSVRAVVPIHYAGVGCDLTSIGTVVDRWPRAELVEDNAHGLFGRYRGSPLGSFGRFATLSFHETKNFICGEGGALILNDAADVNRANVLYHKGTNRTAFLLGMADKYTWQDTGSSFGLSDVLAAYLYGQLEQRDEILARRRRVFDDYHALLKPAASRLGVRLPQVPPDREHAYHMFHVLLSESATRDQVLGAMHDDGVHATFHYVPLHRSPHARRVGVSAECPVTDDISGRLLRLPFFTDMTGEETSRAAESFLSALHG